MSADVMAEIREQIDLVETHACTAPDRILLATILPPGVMLVTPMFDEDGLLWKGHFQILMHPDDWEALADSFNVEDRRPGSVGSLFGIPVVREAPGALAFPVPPTYFTRPV